MIVTIGIIAGIQMIIKAGQPPGFGKEHFVGIVKSFQVEEL